MIKQPVIFRKFKEGDVIALLPGIPVNFGRIMSYQHIGQHSEADSSLLYDTKLATPEEYADLLAELRQRYEADGYYELVVRKRVSYKELKSGWGGL